MLFAWLAGILWRELVPHSLGSLLVLTTCFFSL